ncbi:MAG: hypothetical protein ACXVWF_03570 [Actinomycetota bacterium]
MTPSYGPLRRLRDRHRARRDGRRDGLLGIPTRDEVAHPPALLQIRHRADEALAALAREWTNDDARLRERGAASHRGFDAVRRDAEERSTAVAAIERRHEANVQRRDAFAAQPSSEGASVRIGARVYAVAIVAILVAEFPLNAIAFRLFGEAEVLTWVMTASLAVTLVLCAHGLGTFLRIEHPRMAERRWVAVLVVLPVLALVAIAVIRARYLSMEAALTGLDVLGPVVGSLAFLVINLLVYTGATMLSYLAHAPRTPGMREATEAADVSDEELTRAQQRLTEAIRRERRFEREASQTGVATDEALRIARSRAQELVAYHRQLIAVYCTANLRARGNPEVPAVLRELPPIAIPAPLADEEPAGASPNGHASGASVAALADGPAVSR